MLAINLESLPESVNQIKKNIEIAMIAKGRNVFTGLPESFEISNDEVYEALVDAVDSILP